MAHKYIHGLFRPDVPEFGPVRGSPLPLMVLEVRCAECGVLRRQTAVPPQSSIIACPECGRARRWWHIGNATAEMDWTVHKDFSRMGIEYKPKRRKR